jgi:uncharacterized membrane protein
MPDTEPSGWEEVPVAELIAIGYRDTRTAHVAMDEVGPHAADLRIRPDAVAVIVRDEAGRFTAITNAAEPVGPTYMMFWGLLFSHLFFVPFLGMGLGSTLQHLVVKLERVGLTPAFEVRIRDALGPGTSALFAIVETSPEELLRQVRRFGGTVATTPIAEDGFADLHEALHGRASATRRGAGTR